MTPSFVRKSVIAVGAGLLGFVALAFVAAPYGTNYADAKGKPGANIVAASISIDSADPHLGDWVTFSVSGVNAKSPRIQVMCYQGSTLVYGEAGPSNQSFLLGGGMSQWLMKGGEADCIATVYEWDFHPQQTFVPYASVTFHAGGVQ